MLGGHLDSWHSGTGATDNAAGCAVTMEAMRILKALGVKLRRTMRLALWTGEEQGLLGSRAYVKEHFARPGNDDAEARAREASWHTSTSTTALARFAASTCRATRRSAHLQQLAGAVRRTSAATMTTANTGGTDHLSFDTVGLPGFQFIQDQIGIRGPHPPLEHGRLGSLQPGDLMQNVVIVASFVYNAANREREAAEQAAAQAAARTADDAVGGEADAELELVKGLGIRR